MQTVHDWTRCKVNTFDFLRPMTLSASSPSLLRIWHRLVLPCKISYTRIIRYVVKYYVVRVTIFFIIRSTTQQYIKYISNPTYYYFGVIHFVIIVITYYLLRTYLPGVLLQFVHFTINVYNNILIISAAAE